jgi:hypothetical protein
MQVFLKNLPLPRPLPETGREKSLAPPSSFGKGAGGLGVFLATLQNQFQNPLQLMSHLGIRESHYLEPEFGKRGIALCIRLALLFVNRSIQFHDQSRPVAVEIDNISTNDLLPSKVKTAQTIGPNMIPESFLSDRHVSTKLLGSLDFGRIDASTADDVLDRRTAHGN